MTEPIIADIEDESLAPVVAEQFRLAFGLPDRPETLTEWTQNTSRLIQEAYLNNFEELISTESSRHAVQIGGGIYHCRGLFDALLLPFPDEETSAFRIRSQAPDSGTTVKVRGTRDALSVSPADGVASFGVAEDIVAPSISMSHRILPTSGSISTPMRFPTSRHTTGGRAERTTWSRWLCR